jgi:hypothetical protein
MPGADEGEKAEGRGWLPRSTMHLYVIITIIIIHCVSAGNEI